MGMTPRELYIMLYYGLNVYVTGMRVRFFFK